MDNMDAWFWIIAGTIAVIVVGALIGIGYIWGYSNAHRRFA